jgi:hypothetical protein
VKHVAPQKARQAKTNSFLQAMDFNGAYQVTGTTRNVPAVAAQNRRYQYLINPYGTNQ